MSACGPDRDIYVFVSSSDRVLHVSECDCERDYYELPIGSCWDYRDCPCMFASGCLPGVTVSGSTLRLSGCNAVAEVPLPTTFPTFTRDEAMVVGGAGAESIWFERFAVDDGKICRQASSIAVSLEDIAFVRVEGPTMEYGTDLGTVHVIPVAIAEGQLR